MPFGLINGPAIYQQDMDDDLFEFLDDFCQAYLDDIPIQRKTRKEHVQHIKHVLRRLWEAALQVDVVKHCASSEEIKGGILTALSSRG